MTDPRAREMTPPLWVAPLWRTDRALSVLLGSLVTLIFIVPQFRNSAGATLLVQIFITLVFVSGLSAATQSRAMRAVGTVIVVVAITFHWLDYFYPGAGFAPWSAIGRLLALTLLTMLVGSTI